jgi:hypothetical protein|tara:strand:+ start:216 stop:590 length:375 start_codon:yes stop_codon:yes gene_type:complete
MNLIPRNVEQLRRLAIEESEKKNQPRFIDRTNQNSNMKIDIASMRKSVTEQKINNYLSDEVATEELISTLTHYSMINMKDRVFNFIETITQNAPNAFTIRTVAEFISDYTNEYNVAKNIKENKR